MFHAVQGDWKLLIGSLEQSGWVGPQYPNGTTNWLADDSVYHCTLGTKAV